jgi:biopolymer transport protein ExbB/TolQ
MKTKRTLLIVGIVAGAVMMLSPFIGLAGTVFGMIKAFQVLGSSGVADPEVLGGAIGEVLISTVAGIIVAIPGVLLFIGCIVGLVRLNSREAKKLGNEVSTVGATSL